MSDTRRAEPEPLSAVWEHLLADEKLSGPQNGQLRAAIRALRQHSDDLEHRVRQLEQQLAQRS